MKLRVALAMKPELTPDLLGWEQWARLEQIADILDHAPIADFTHAPDDLLVRTDALLTGWGCPPVDADMLRRTPRLKLVAHTGSTVKSVMSQAAWDRGITVVSAAAANAVPVAEYALAAILFANKGVFAARESYRRARRPDRYPWTASGTPGNQGAVVGIVGASRTARRLLQLLKGFSLQVLIYDPVTDPAELRALGTEPVTLQALFERSDVVSIHAPLLPQTRGMIGAKLLRLLRDGATLINTARGDVVNQEALERELAAGRISAVLDVTSPEPLSASSRLFDLPNAFVTPHVAGAAGFETRRLADLAIEEIARYASGQPLRYDVKREMLEIIG